MMKIMLRPLILVVFGLGATSAPAQDAAIPPVDVAAEPPAELRALADSCAAHKFETMLIVAGRERPINVKICGKQGQSDADWLVTLRDSVAKTEANDELEQPVRDEIVGALKTEIARLESMAAAAAATRAEPSATIAVSREPVRVPEAAPQYSSVPALPAPKPRASGSPSNPSAAPPVRPRLSIRCALPRETFATCATLERETQLMIRADENLAAGTTLRFLRGGDARAELDLGTLRKGAALREKLPGRVCSGVLRGKVQVQVLSNGRVAETLGPYPLYCGS